LQTSYLTREALQQLRKVLVLIRRALSDSEHCHKLLRFFEKVDDPPVFDANPKKLLVGIQLDLSLLGVQRQAVVGAWLAFESFESPNNPLPVVSGQAANHLPKLAIDLDPI
jgi:hypothetical protein